MRFSFVLDEMVLTMGSRLCSIAMFLLISWVLQSRINRHKFQGDDLEIPYAIFTPQAATNSTGQVPNMVRMFNPTQS